MSTIASRVTGSRPTPHHPREAPRQPTKQDVPLSRQPVVGRHRHGGCHRPGEDVGPPLPHPRDKREKYGGERKVEAPARGIFDRATESPPNKRGSRPREDIQEPAAEQERPVATPLVELTHGKRPVLVSHEVRRSVSLEPRQLRENGPEGRAHQEMPEPDDDRSEHDSNHRQRRRPDPEHQKLGRPREDEGAHQGGLASPEPSLARQRPEHEACGAATYSHRHAPPRPRERPSRVKVTRSSFFAAFSWCTSS